MTKKMFNLKAALLLLMNLILLLSVLPLQAMAADSWVAKANMPAARVVFGTASVNGKIYAIGGGTASSGTQKTVYEFNPSTNTWTTKADMLAPRDSFGTAVVDNKIYTFGGGSVKVEVYDPISNTWAAKNSMPTYLSSPKAAAVNGKIYVTSGNIMQEYDPASDTWVNKANVPTSRVNSMVISLNNQVYVIGGGGTTTVEAYNPATDTWETKAPLQTGRSYAGAASANGKIYIMGGFSTKILNSVEEYNPITNTWTYIAPITTRYELGAASVDGKLFAIGGRVSATGITTLTEEYTTVQPAPAAPANLAASAGDSSVTLSWTAAEGASAYNLKRASTPGGPYSTIVSGITDLTYVDAAVTNGVTYYYIVTSVTGSLESEASNEAAATPQAALTNRALLVITMSSGLEKEYDLSAAELQQFLAWYEDRATGIGSPLYSFNKTFNKGPFLSRTDYIVFDKILTFEVNEYAIE